ncbi:MAG: phosphoribosylanthranilate isomerase [Flavobacteriaceae bacterium]|nr:phosphoribosylanthranilate isomerase [Flavobacteriaceae bacterium]
MKLKICGMKYPENILKVAALQPDYLGFIFYKKSKRHFDGTLPTLPKSIKKVGVFVDASNDYINDKIKRYNLQTIQLHGEESPEFCKQFYNKNTEVIKVFSVGNNFDFNILEKYEPVADYFLFDTKGAQKGGNGISFDWTLLDNYPSQKPYFLSGGIGLESVDDLKLFKKSPASKYGYALDINSRFEEASGQKNIEKLKAFKNTIL